MRNPQFASLLFLALAVILFLFSLALVPPVELYCRLQRPAVLLLILQVVLLSVRISRREPPAERPLVIASFVFIALGVAFNSLLLLLARGRR